MIQLSIFPGRYFEGFFRRFENSFFLLLFTFLRLKRPLRFGKELYPLNYELIRDLVRHNYYKKELSRKAEGPAFFFHEWQLITPATKQEELLLSSSLQFFIPQEVCQVVMHLRTGEKLIGAQLRGGLFSGGSYEKINRAIHHLLQTQPITFDDVSKIEILHSHPSIDFILETSDEESYLYVNGLSKSDLELATILSQQWKALVTVKAVTHSKLSYAVTYAHGKVVNY